MIGLTLDTGALIAFERGTGRARTLLATLHSDERRVVVPAAVVLEWWRGQRGPAAKLLQAFEVEPLSEELAKTAGLAIAAVGATTVDAVVMASAAQRGDAVLTSDLGDLILLRDYFPGVRVLSV